MPTGQGRPNNAGAARRTEPGTQSPRQTPLPPHTLARLIMRLRWCWAALPTQTQEDFIAKSVVKPLPGGRGSDQAAAGRTDEKRRGGRAELKGLHPEPWTLSSAPTRPAARAAAAGPNFEAMPSPGREPGSPIPRQLPQGIRQVEREGTAPSRSRLCSGHPHPSTADTAYHELCDTGTPEPRVAKRGRPGISDAEVPRVGGRGAGGNLPAGRRCSVGNKETGVDMRQRTNENRGVVMVSRRRH